MGACITMRDDSLDTPIPVKFEPSDYHLKALQDAVDALCEQDKMTTEEAWNESRRKCRATIRKGIEGMKKQQELRKKYEDMLAQVNAWVPPSPDHVEFKKFMIQQITSSIEWDCNGDYYLRESVAKPLSGKKYLREMKERAVRDIVYHNEENKKEIERAADRTRWVNQLRDSLMAVRDLRDQSPNGDCCQG
jgi:hypothetical protein